MSDERDSRNQWGDDLNKYLGFDRGMDLWSKPGAKVVAWKPDAGYDADRQKFRQFLTIGNEYTIDHTEVGDCHTDVYLVEVPKVAFNSVHFINAYDLPATKPDHNR